MATLSSHRGAPRAGCPPEPSADGAAVLAATFGLEYLYERAGSAYIRLPLHRRQQGAGCEWHERRVNGRLLHVAFTAETGEDWSAMAAREPSQVLALYRGLLGRPEIRVEELFWQTDVFARDGKGAFVLAHRAGAYNPLNPWNTLRGAVHRNGAGASTAAALRPAALRLFRPDGTEVSAALLRVTRRDPATGAALRVSVDASGDPASTSGLDSLRLADGSQATPARMARLLLPEAAGIGIPHAPMVAWTGPDGMGPSLPTPTLPGPMIAAALARAALTQMHPVG